MLKIYIWNQCFKTVTYAVVTHDAKNKPLLLVAGVAKIHKWMNDCVLGHDSALLRQAILGQRKPGQIRWIWIHKPNMTRWGTYTWVTLLSSGNFSQNGRLPHYIYREDKKWRKFTALWGWQEMNGRNPMCISSGNIDVIHHRNRTTYK